MKLDSAYISFLKLYTKLFARTTFSKWNQFLVTIGLHGLGIDNYYDDNLSGERYALIEIIKKLKRPLVIDVGAHIGDSAMLILSINPSAQIFSFEPNPKTFKKLKQNSRKYHYYPFNLALGNREGSIFLYDAKNSGSSPFSTVYPSVIESIHHSTASKYTVKMTTLDKFYEKYIKSGNIDFLKIDVEGNELKVLEGAKILIKKGKITCIQFEFNAMNRFSRTFFIDLENILKNYNLYRLLPSGMLKINSDSLLNSEIFLFQNILAIHK